MKEVPEEAECSGRDEVLVLDEHLWHVCWELLEALSEEAEREPLAPKPPLREEPEVVEPALQELPLHETAVAPLHLPLQHAVQERPKQPPLVVWVDAAFAAQPRHVHPELLHWQLLELQPLLLEERLLPLKKAMR